MRRWGGGGDPPEKTTLRKASLIRVKTQIILKTSIVEYITANCFFLFKMF